jgi:hypothetical protein
MTGPRSPECEMGFADLFRLARKRAWTPDEEHEFQALDQDARNAAVKQLAQETDCVHTADRLGTDGVIYTAFWLEGLIES